MHIIGGIWSLMGNSRLIKGHENMSTEETRLQHDPRKISDILFACANRFWSFSLAAKFGSVLLGALFLIFLPSINYSYLPIALVFIAGEFFSWRTDSFKSK